MRGRKRDAAARRRASSWIDWRTGAVTRPGVDTDYRSDHLQTLLTVRWLGETKPGRDCVYLIALANDKAGRGSGNIWCIQVVTLWKDLQVFLACRRATSGSGVDVRWEYAGGHGVR